VETPDCDLSQALEAALGIPVVQGNRVAVLRNGDEIFPEMLSAIGESAHFIEFVSFIYWTGRIAEQVAKALAERARLGIVVRVILDSHGARPMPQELIDDMKAAGVEIKWFRPLSRWRFWQNDHRTHRKLLICDGTIGFTGGVGIAREWEGDARNPDEWRDTHFKIEGPAVRNMRAAFIGNWVEAGGRGHELGFLSKGNHSPIGEVGIQVVRSTASVGWSDIATAMHTLIALSRKTVNITTAYFVPDHSSIELLREATQRGVHVRILVPGPYINHELCQLAGQREYRPLLDAGIAISQYQPTMLHSKIITVDGQLACVGSANLNQRSLRKDDELCLLVSDAGTVSTLDDHFEDDIAVAKQINLADWKNRSVVRRIREQVGRIFRSEL
jgi:cardiolipin synthase